MGFLNGGITAVEAGQRAEDRAYQNMQNQYAAQAATRRAEADALARMQMQQQRQAGLDVSGDYTGYIPGVVKVQATPKATAATVEQGATGGQTQATAPKKMATVPTDLQDVSIGRMVKKTHSGGGYSPENYSLEERYLGDTALGFSDALSYFFSNDKPRYTGREQYYKLDPASVKTYNSNLAFIPKYQKSPLAGRISQYAAQVGIDPNILHAIALQETSGGTRIKDSPQGASGALQITEGAYKDVKSRIPQFTKDPKILEMVASLPSDWSKATPEDKIKGGVLYAKLLSMIGAKGNNGKPVSPSRVLAGYFGGESRLKGDLPSVRDSLGRMLPDYVAMTTGYYNAMNPQAQSDMLAVADGSVPQTVQTAQTGTPAQAGVSQGGLSVSGNYAAPAVPQAPQVSQAPQQEAGLTRLVGSPQNNSLPVPIQRLAALQQNLRTRADAMAQTGAFDQYQQLATQEIAVTTQLYDQLAELGAAELTQFGAPRRLMSLLSTFSGQNAQVQLRSDGKLDLYLDGQKVSGKDGLSASRLSTMVKNMVSAQARAQYTAAATEAMKQQAALLEAQLKGQYDLAGRAVTGQYNIAAARAHANASGGGTKTIGTLSDGTVVTYSNDRGYEYVTPGGTQEVNGEEVATAPTVRPIAGIVPFTNVLQ